MMNDELLEKAVKISCEKESPFDCEPHEFSSEFLDKMQKLTELPEPIKYHRHQKLKFRYALVAILILILGTTSIAGSISRKNVIQYSEQLFSDHTEVSFIVPQTINKRPRTLNLILPSYIPENFSLPEDFTPMSKFFIKNLKKCTVTYRDNKGIFLNITQRLLDFSEDDHILSVPSNGNPAMRLEINGYPAYWIAGSDGLNTIIYTRSDYLFYIDGYIDVKELIKMLESLKKQ